MSEKRASRLRLYPYLPNDIRDLVLAIGQTVHPVPDFVCLDKIVVYPPTGSTSAQRWMLMVDLRQMEPDAYLEIIRSKGFPNAVRDGTSVSEGRHLTKFILRDATDEEVSERL